MHIPFSTDTLTRTIFFLFSAEIALALILSAPSRGLPPPPESGLAFTQEPAAASPVPPNVRPRGRPPDLFSGDFWEAGVDPDPAPAEDIPASPTAHPTDGEDSGILEPAAADNPRNPSTGERFTDKQMQRFDGLNRRFPGNSLVPRRRGSVRRLMEAEANIVAIERQGHQAAASADQIEQVYQFYIARETANIRLLEYLKKFAETDDQRARHRWLQKRSHTAIQQRRRQRERFLKMLEARAEEDET